MKSAPIWMHFKPRWREGREVHPPAIVQVACVAVAAFGVNAPSWGAEPNVVGNWKLVSSVAEELTTGKTPQGRMMALLVHETRIPPKVDEDRINLHKYMGAYSGRYTIEGGKGSASCRCLVERGLDRHDQVRFVKVEGDRLTITTAPAKHPITGVESTSVLVWEREH